MSASKIINFIGGSILGVFSAASFNGAFDCYENDSACTTHIVNKLAKRQAAENWIQKGEPEIKQNLESGDQAFTFDTKSNVITVTEADVEKERVSNKESARNGGLLFGTVAATFLAGSLPRPGRRRKDGDGPDDLKGKFMENHLG